MDKPLYNSIVVKNYLEYLKNEYPDMNFRQLLDYAEISEYEVEDSGHWLTQIQINRFHEYLIRKTGNRNISRLAGQYTASPKANGFAVMRRFVAAFLSPAIAYWALEKLSRSLTRHATLQSRNLTGNKMELVITPQAGIKEESFQCENRLGVFEAVAQIFTGRYAIVEHPECLHKGSTRCRYIVSWESPKSLLWRKTGYYVLTASALAFFPFLFFFPLIDGLIAALSSVLLATGILLGGAMIRNREMAEHLIQQGKISEEFNEQINLRYNESLLIREIGESASSILNTTALLTFITERLHARLLFERSMILLANPEKTGLHYSAGHGFTPHEEALLRNIHFDLTRPESRGYFYQAYIHQKPVILEKDDLSQADLPGKNYALIRDLGVKSFICVPIVYEKKTEGILAVDISEQSSRPAQSIVSLLIGIAQHIGVSLNNAAANKKIHENEQRFFNLSENAADIIYQLDVEGILRYVNPAWEDILGHQKADVEGRAIFEFLSQEDRMASKKLFRQILRDKLRIRDRYLTIFNSRGLPRQILLSGAPDIDAAGKIIGIIGSMKDITRLRSLEAQLLQASRMEAMGTLTGGIVHDFNNIIQAIMGYNQLMMAGRLGHEEDLPYLTNMGELIARSRELVRQLLLFSKEVEPSSRVVNINEEIKSIRNLLSKSIPRMIEIRTDLSEDIFPVSADSTQIGQIIMNLVLNAGDAIDESGVINIRTDNLVVCEKTIIGGFQIKPGSYVELSVADTGCGMDDDMMKRIFEPFFTTKEPGKGTGLGLAVVHGIVKNHNGYIFCESKPRRGATFHIIFPATSGGIREAIPQQVRQNIYGTEKILLVDDEKGILETVRDTLQLYGYRVVTAESGEEAVHAYIQRKDEFDLVILDLIMPGGGGKKCLQDLLQINPSVKVLISSGYAGIVQTHDLALAGAAGFINKPYQPEDLFFSIRKILDTRTGAGNKPSDAP